MINKLQNYYGIAVRASTDKEMLGQLWNSAVINFNTGASCVLNVMKEYGIQDGHYANIFCAKKDEGRIKECFRKQAKWKG